MRPVRKFVSLLALLSIGLAPLALAGCGQKTTPPPSETDAPRAKTTTTTSQTIEKTVSKPKGKKKAKAASPESASTTGPGVTPPVKK